jgi:hypothetical protein
MRHGLTDPMVVTPDGDGCVESEMISPRTSTFP